MRVLLLQRRRDAFEIEIAVLRLTEPKKLFAIRVLEHVDHPPGLRSTRIDGMLSGAVQRR